MKRKTGKASAKQYHFSMDVMEGALLALNASEVISQAFLQAQSSKHFELYPSIVGRQKIGEFGFGSDMLQAQTCDWNDSEVNLDGKEVEACPFSIMVTICQWDVERSFIAAKAGLNKPFSEPVPAELQSIAQEKIAEKVGEELEYITWKGDDQLEQAIYGYLALCDGLEKKAAELAADGTIPATSVILGVEVTSANVIATLTSAFNKLPNKLKQRKSELKWFVSQNIADAYLIATATQSNEVYFLTDRPLNFLGIEMVAAAGSSDNVIMISRKLNFAKLTDLLSEVPTFNTVNMKNTTNEPKWRVRTDMKYGVELLNEDEFVVMLPAPTVDTLTPDTGAAASTVVIDGDNFNGATSVTFDGTPATFTIVNGKQIEAVVPALGAGAVDVVVTTPFGSSTAVTFTVA